MFRSIPAETITDNPFKLFGVDWTLITAGPPEAFNMMTAAWAGLGVLWSKNVAFCFIRPQRYTYQFMEKAGNFTLSFFEEKYRSALDLCGNKSGRDINKAAEAGLTSGPGTLEGTTCFAEARLVLVCRKIHFQDINPQGFVDPSIAKNYVQHDYHRMYIGEIVDCLAG